MNDDYWFRTDRMIAEGKQPTCTYCGALMIPEDDHGRFTCFCVGYRQANMPNLPPQLTEDVPDEIKEHIHPLNRLDLPPTKKEQEFVRRALKGDLDSLLD